MNIKDTINFKKIREKGPKSIEIKDDEVVQIVSGDKEILCVVRQAYLFQLEQAMQSLLLERGLTTHKEIDFNEKIKSLDNRFNEIIKLIKEDKQEFKK